MSVEELTAQVASLTADVQARDTSIIGLVDAVQTYERTTEALKAEIAALTAQAEELKAKVAEQEGVIASYRDSLIEHLRKLLK